VTVVDDFSDNSISGDWSNWGGGQVTESSQRLNLATTTSAAYYGIQRTNTLDINESYVGTRIVSAGNQALTSYNAYPIAIQLSTNNDIYWIVSNGNISCWTTVAGTATQRSSTTYNATNHAWLRIGEVGGNIRWEYSADGNSWNTQTTLANPFSGDTVGIPYIMVGTDGAEGSTTTLQVDDYSTWTAAVEVTGVAAAPLGTLTATAAGGPTTTGTAVAALGSLSAAASGAPSAAPVAPRFPVVPLPMTVWYAPGADPVAP